MTAHDPKETSDFDVHCAIAAVHSFFDILGMRTQRMAEARPQRRLAAILAADVAGYSRLMGEDEEGTLAALTAHSKDLYRALHRRASGPFGENDR